MPRPGSFDDDAIDALLAGTPRGEDGAGLSSFIQDLRTAAGAVPTPSHVLAAAIAAGGISTHQPHVAQWRKLRVKIQGLLAGLGIAGKVALGVGVAAAATTGAGAAGALPGPVQHAVSNAVGAVTPFSIPDPDHHTAHDGNLAGGDTTTTTTIADGTTTTVPKGAHDGTGNDKGKGSDGTDNGGNSGDGNGVVTPTTTGEHHGDGEGATTTTVAHDGNGSNDGNGGGNSDGHDTTPTTEHHGDGDNNNPESLSIHCERSANPASISCTWSASTLADHASYVLLRVGDGHGRVELQSDNALQFTDYSVVSGLTYGYRVDSLRADGSVSSHSAMVYVECCGGTTTPTTEHHGGDGTTTTTTGDHH